jgi:glycosyltransferase involved in cell wall biosynthesis
MKVLILTEFYAPAWAFGGPPKVLSGIASELARRGHSVSVFTANVLDAHNEITDKQAVIEGVKVTYLETWSRRLAWNYKIFVPKGLRKSLKENIKDYDVVLLASFRTIFNWLGYRYAKKFGIPYVILPYGTLPRAGVAKRILKFILDQFYGHRTLRDASAVLAQTEHEMEESRKFGAREENIRLVPLHIDMSEFEKLPPKGTFRKKIGISSDEKVILFLGRLHKYKGLGLLLESFSHIVQTHDDWRLVIVGRDDGYLASTLKLIEMLRLGKKALFVGPLYEKDRIEAYVDADVFVMPSSHFEETSTAALEACASHTPVIVTKQASIPGLDEYKAGFTINYNSEELKDALSKTLDDKKLRTKMGENARRMIEEKFTLSRVTDQFEKILQSLARSSDSPEKARD